MTYNNLLSSICPKHRPSLSLHPLSSSSLLVFTWVFTKLCHQTMSIVLSALLFELPPLEMGCLIFLIIALSGTAMVIAQFYLLLTVGYMDVMWMTYLSFRSSAILARPRCHVKASWPIITANSPTSVLLGVKTVLCHKLEVSCVRECLFGM